MEKVSQIKYLVVTVYDRLNWQSLIRNIIPYLRSGLRAFYQLRNFHSSNTLNMVYDRIMHSKLQYETFCWGCAHDNAIMILKVIQKCDVRKVVGARKHITT